MGALEVTGGDRQIYNQKTAKRKTVRRIRSS